MKFRPKNIEVGAKYRHKTYSTTTYLGVGTRKVQTGIEYKEWFVRKGLVIIDVPHDSMTQDIGSMVVSPKKNPVFWDGFYKVEDAPKIESDLPF